MQDGQAFAERIGYPCILRPSFTWAARAAASPTTAKNFTVICAIENFYSMGVHTGDSLTVAPAQTLTDVEYQKMRDADAG